MSKKDVDVGSGTSVVGVVGTGRRGVAELLNALRDAKGVDFELLNEQLGTGGWYISDGGFLRALLAGVVPPEDVDGLIERAYADPSVLYDVEELFNAAAAKTKDDVADKVCKISQAHYSDYVAFVEKRADYFLRVLDAILERNPDESTRVQAVERRLGPVYDAEIASVFDELRHTDDVDLGRRLISVISEVSPDLFSKLLDRYCQTAI